MLEDRLEFRGFMYLFCITLHFEMSYRCKWIHSLVVIMHIIVSIGWKFINYIDSSPYCDKLSNFSIQEYLLFNADIDARGKRALLFRDTSKPHLPLNSSFVLNLISWFSGLESDSTIDHTAFPERGWLIISDSHESQRIFVDTVQGPTIFRAINIELTCRASSGVEQVLIKLTEASMGIL